MYDGTVYNVLVLDRILGQFFSFEMNGNPALITGLFRDIPEYLSRIFENLKRDENHMRVLTNKVIEFQSRGSPGIRRD